MTKVLGELYEMLEEELRKIIKKGDLTTTELENANKAVCLMEKIKNIDTMETMDYSEGRGRSPVTGRYVSRGMNSYSGHSIKDRMIARLEGMYDEAQTEHERQVVDTWIKRIESEK